MKVFLVFDEWRNEGEYEDQRHGETYHGTYDTLEKAINSINEIVSKIKDSIKQCFDMDDHGCGCSIIFELKVPDNGVKKRDDHGIIEYDVCYLRECATDIYSMSDVETLNHNFYIKEVEVQ